MICSELTLKKYSTLKIMDVLQTSYAKIQAVSNMEFVRKLMEKWRSQSKFLRVIAVATTSVTGYLSCRYLYIKAKRKYYGLPPGMVGMPLIGVVGMMDKWLSTVPGQYGDVMSVSSLGSIPCVSFQIFP